MVITASSSSENRFDSVVADDNGNYYLSGLGYEQIQMGDLQYNNPSAYLPFLTKISTQVLSTNRSEELITQIYPNPAENYFFVKGLNEVTPATIYDVMGKEIKKVTIAPSERIETSDLTKGIYLLKIDKSHSVKFIKK